MSSHVSVPARVVATPQAEALLARLREKHGAVLFHQSGGCCDGSSPMCYRRPSSWWASAACASVRLPARRST